MSTASPDRALLEEAWHRFAGHRAVKASAQTNIASYVGSVFDKQRDFIADPARKKVARTTRRSGKTNTAPRYLIKEAAIDEESWCFYFGLTRERAKDLLWPALEAADRDFRLGLHFNKTDLTVKVPGGGTIKLTGADKAREIQKYRGYKIRLALVDEAQSFGAHLRPLVDEVVGPALLDTLGTTVLLGTPGVVCAGLFYDATAGSDVAQWSQHRWSVLDNPYIPHAAAEIARIKERNGWTDETPIFRREYLGEWVEDTEGLFYKFDPRRNLYTELPTLPGRWKCVLGWDIGFHDSMALVLWGFHDDSPDLYELFSWKASGVLSPEVMAEVLRLRAKYDVLAMVADTSGGSKVLVEEQRPRHGLLFEAAKKSEKFSHVEMFNADLQAGHIKIREGSPLHTEIAILPKDPDSPAHKPPREHPSFENHCCDAGLYAWRRAQHWLPKEVVPALTGEAASNAEAERMEQNREEAHNARKSEDWWEH